MLIPPLAFVGWAMLDPASSWSSVVPGMSSATRILIGLYGGGQFVASIGMFVAGGYGALRKTPSSATSLDTVAIVGMAVHGIASIYTILGGAAFVVVAIWALWRPAEARATVGL